MRTLKTAILKTFLYHKWDTFVGNLNQRLPYMKTNGLGIEVGVQPINFIIPLCATYIRHSQGNQQRLSRHLLKQIQRFVRLLQQEDCWGTAELSDVFKFLPWQKDCQQLYSWNSNADQVPPLTTLFFLFCFVNGYVTTSYL